MRCKHRIGKVCKAFLTRIPVQVFKNTVVHDRPLPEFGQTNNIIFEVDEEDKELDEKIRENPNWHKRFD